MRIVVIGYGMAGARLAEDIRRCDPDGSRAAVTVLGAEDRPAYNRILLSSVIGGSLTPDALDLHHADWAGTNGIDLRIGTTVQRIDRERRAVVLADGDTVEYDSLVLATGSRAWMPPTEGLLNDDGEPAQGVIAFRTMDDCRQIVEAARPGAPVAVLGGGLLGLEAARGLAARGARVTVVHPVGHLMERQLDPGAGRVLADILGTLGIEFRFDVTASKYLPGDGLKLADGSHVPADVVVVSAGVRAETTLAAEAGLVIDRGVIVDDQLRTSDPRIHAIGDCAQHSGTVGGFIQPGWEQADVVAKLLTGTDPAARYHGTAMVTRLKAKGIDLAAIGDGLADADEVLRFEDPKRGRYAKLVLRDDRVTGAILLGLPDAAATITQLYDRKWPAPEDRLALLLGRILPGERGIASSAGDLPASAVVCRCNSVSKGRLVAEWRSGARDVSALAEATRATTGCGGCRDQVAGICEWLAAQDPE